MFNLTKETKQALVVMIVFFYFQYTREYGLFYIMLSLSFLLFMAFVRHFFNLEIDFSNFYVILLFDYQVIGQTIFRYVMNFKESPLHHLFAISIYFINCIIFQQMYEKLFSNLSKNRQEKQLNKRFYVTAFIVYIQLIFIRSIYQLYYKGNLLLYQYMCFQYFISLFSAVLCLIIEIANSFSLDSKINKLLVPILRILKLMFELKIFLLKWLSLRAVKVGPLILLSSLYSFVEKFYHQFLYLKLQLNLNKIQAYKKDVQEPAICKICLTELETAVVLQCTHEFHHECLERFSQVSTSVKCPQCGKTIRVNMTEQLRKIEREKIE